MTSPATSGFDAIGVHVHVVVSEAGALPQADALVREHLAAVDLACSRFRDDSELQQLKRHAGAPVQVSRLLAEAIDRALDAARWTAGIVDPCLGADMIAAGYDRDFSELASQGSHSVPRTSASVSVLRRPRWSDVEWDRASRTITVPRGCALDLGATAKAWAADTCADLVHEATGSAVLVNLGGDIATRGAPASGSWSVQLLETSGDDVVGAPVVQVGTGGLATSGVRARRWTHGGSEMHHILDPSTGRPSDAKVRTVSVWAPTCYEANILSTAAIAAPRKGIELLRRSGRAARIVAADGGIVQLNHWPAEVAS